MSWHRFMTGLGDNWRTEVRDFADCATSGWGRREDTFVMRQYNCSVSASSVSAGVVGNEVTGNTWFGCIDKVGAKHSKLHRDNFSQHHHEPFCEGRGLTHALTDIAPTDLTVATHSPLGAQPQSDRILRLPCGRFVCQPLPTHMFSLDALKRACRSSSLQASRSARSAAIGLPWALVRKDTPGSRTGAHGRNR